MQEMKRKGLDNMGLRTIARVARFSRFRRSSTNLYAHHPVPAVAVRDRIQDCVRVGGGMRAGEESGHTPAELDAALLGDGEDFARACRESGGKPSSRKLAPAAGAGMIAIACHLSSDAPGGGVRMLPLRVHSAAAYRIFAQPLQQGQGLGLEGRAPENHACRATRLLPDSPISSQGAGVVGGGEGRAVAARIQKPHASGLYELYGNPNPMHNAAVPVFRRPLRCSAEENNKECPGRPSKNIVPAQRENDFPGYSFRADPLCLLSKEDETKIPTDTTLQEHDCAFHSNSKSQCFYSHKL
ncbi:Shikimate dehydrogenase (NADP(+)) [Frankliniella fusca]|uniref:Shikimate dehydrogenase (NADP(+)) n=1 Tax=Frankliniella fusca TaxID=407009 RepID=A0AAE1HDP5_9NEOP|nr:Shikimate dehydrogenase (NADP(+)) [Frankliniella fusca]